MKKILLIVALVAGASQLKAQALVKPMDSLLLKTPNFYKNIRPDDTSLFKKYFVVPPIQNQAPLAVLKPVTGQYFASRMPVLKVSSDDRMPIAKVSSNDRMPVAVVKSVDPLRPVTP